MVSSIASCKTRGERADDLVGGYGQTEIALNQASLVSLLLRNKIQTIRMEIETLTEMLENDQDPVKMGEIQELIGVSPIPLAGKMFTDVESDCRSY